MEFIISASSDIGNVKSTNQDSLNVRVLETSGGKMVLAVLCDGMGGLQCGEVASASVVNAFCKWSEERLPAMATAGIKDEDISRDWTDIAVDMNNKIKAYGAQNGFKMGTTVTAMLITQDRYYIINVGDSRAYEISTAARPLTEDQTVVAMEVKNGLLTEEQAAVDPRRSVLLQCIGASDTVRPDIFFGQPVQNAVYMLCSDGFRHEITPEEIYSCFNADNMMSAEDMQKNELYLIGLNKQRSERDNISVITVRTF